MGFTAYKGMLQLSPFVYGSAEKENFKILSCVHYLLIAYVISLSGLWSMRTIVWKKCSYLWGKVFQSITHKGSIRNDENRCRLKARNHVEEKCYWKISTTATWRRRNKNSSTTHVNTSLPTWVLETSLYMVKRHIVYRNYIVTLDK